MRGKGYLQSSPLILLEERVPMPQCHRQQATSVLVVTKSHIISGRKRVCLDSATTNQPLISWRNVAPLGKVEIS